MHIFQRPRRLRQNRIIRDMVAETIPQKSKLIMPYFVIEGEGIREPIPSMPGIDRVSLDALMKDIDSDYALGVRAVLLFGIPAHKDDVGSEAYNDEGIVQLAIREIKRLHPDMLVISDICLCEYTSHGHCGLVSEGKILNDATLELLAKIALTHAEAGADIVAPSDMMDGRIAVIRNNLDQHGFVDVPILSYAAKYASSFYGPFRDAAGSTPQFGDRRSYQMDLRNKREALREVLLDIDEGADIVMVKPALAYLDIITKVKEIIDVPLCAYNVSGEYSMVKVMHREGYGDERQLATEILTAIFRAGADMIISYHTRDVFRYEWF